MKKSALCSLVLLMLFAPGSRATLIDQGNGTIYDPDLALIWLQDANYAKTTGYTLGLLPPRSDGRMTYAQATDWVSGLAFAGFEDWYLPTQAQMEHLHFIELGNLIYSAPGYVPGDGDQTPFVNISGSHYWSSTPGVIFNFKEGTSNSGASLDLNQFAAWAVRNGTIVPIPPAVLLFGSAIGLMGVMRRKLATA